jgi:hypothetical protein
MIPKELMLPNLVAVCPTFETGWRSFLEEWNTELDEKPYYLALADFARHLTDMLERNETDSFQQIFDAIETFHIEGDSYVKEAATIGILESLMDAPNAERFRSWFGPESTKWWDKLHRFWNGDVTALRE